MRSGMVRGGAERGGAWAGRERPFTRRKGGAEPRHASGGGSSSPGAGRAPRGRVPFPSRRAGGSEASSASGDFSWESQSSPARQATRWSCWPRSDRISKAALRAHVVSPSAPPRLRSRRARVAGKAGACHVNPVWSGERLSVRRTFSVRGASHRSRSSNSRVSAGISGHERVIRSPAFTTPSQPKAIASGGADAARTAPLSARPNRATRTVR